MPFTSACLRQNVPLSVKHRPSCVTSHADSLAVCLHIIIIIIISVAELQRAPVPLDHVWVLM